MDFCTSEIGNDSGLFDFSRSRNIELVPVGWLIVLASIIFFIMIVCKR